MGEEYEIETTSELSVFLEKVAPELRSLSSVLDSLIHNREQDFLDLGARLMEFTTQSSTLSDGAGALVELCSGENVVQSADALSNELDGLRSVCTLDGESNDITQLDGVIEYLRRLDSDIDEFGRIIRSLQMLGISTRIESARLGDRGLGFSTLADDVESLANKIVTDSSAISGKSKSLTVLLDSVRSSMVSLHEDQHTCSSKILIDIDGTLGELHSMMARSKDAASGLSQRSMEVGGNVAEVVSSLQFHDIVRQQVEHVEEALEDMSTQVGESANKTDEAEIRDIVGWSADVAELQVSQLDNAVERFRSAIDGLRTGLSGIAETVDGMRTDVEDVFSVEGAQGNVFEKIEDSTGAALTSMVDLSGKTEEISKLIGTVAETVSQMTDFVGNIEEVGAEIELIAINASIKAAHTGDEGKALGVLAQAIQRLSVEARERTTSVSNILISVAEASRQLKEDASTQDQKDAIDQYANQQRELLGILNALHRDIKDRMREVSTSCRDFSSDVKRLASGIHLDKDICPGLEGARESFSEIVTQARILVPISDDLNRSERLKQMLSRYTMEMERVVHEAAFGGTSSSDALNHEDEGDVELFGDDDVELFGDDDVELFDAPAGDSDGEDWDNVDLF